MPPEIKDQTDPLPTRWSLIERLKNPEDQEGWSTFAQMYRGLIRGVAIRAGLDEVEAGEVVQDTLLSVHQKIGQFETDPALGTFKGWLLRLTQWRIADQFRKRPASSNSARDQSADGASRTSTAERVPDAMANFETIWEAEWKQNLLTLALQAVKEQVDPEQFQIFDFCALRHWPVKKVAGVMRVNVGQVYLTKHRVAKLLKQKIERLKTELT